MSKFKQYENLNALYNKVMKKKAKCYITVSVILLFFFVMLFEAEINASSIKISFNEIIGFSVLIIIFVPFCWIPYPFRSMDCKLMLKKITDNELARINKEIPRSEKMANIMVTADALIIMKKILVLIPIKDILWIFSTSSTYKVNGIKTSEEFGFVIVDRHRYLSTFQTKKKLQDKNIKFLYEQITRYRKGIFWGYSDELVNAFKKDFQGQVALSEAADAEIHLDQREPEEIEWVQK